MSTTYAHGEKAPFCWDDATPGERETTTILHRHPYNWAIGQGLDRATADTYAAWYTDRN